MNILINADCWGDVMAAQMASAAKTGDVSVWGYACLCVGWKFEDAIARRYDELDHLSGEFLHVFSLSPPPRHIIDRQLARLKSPQVANLDGRLKSHIEKLRDNLRFLETPNREMAREKIVILEQLQQAFGADTNHRTDFVFVRFGDEASIDEAIAATSSLSERPSDYEVADLFADMGKQAAKHLAKGHNLDDFAASLKLQWRAKARLQQAWALRNYIQFFLQKMK